MRVCAHGEVLSVHSPSCSWQLPTAWTRNVPEKNLIDCARQQKESELRSTLTTIETVFARNQFPEASLNLNLSLSFLPFVPPVFVLPLFTNHSCH